MPEEPEAELQATANLSPLSPSPVHSVASQVVPVLQDTVETIDAMVAAASAAAASTATVSLPDAEAKPTTSPLNLDPIPGAGDDDVVDDDSLNDPYSEVDQDVAHQPQQPPAEEIPDTNDDYAKMFDSPIDPEEGEGEDTQPEHISSIPRESNQVSLSSDRFLTNHTSSETSHAIIEAPAPSARPGSSPPSSITEPRVDDEPTPAPLVPAAAASSATLEATPAGLSSQSTDIQRLVADLTAHDDPSASAAKAGQPASSLPPATSLPPRPPVPQAGSQSYSSQPSIPASVAVPSAPGQSSTHAAASDAPGNLPAPLAGHNVHVPSMNASYPSRADGTQDADPRQWEQFVADERKYMSEAKWDRFPEGSRIFIGNLSSEKVSKRDVFNLFSPYGRLAQISLKSAYGFVQYHAVEEGARALESLEGIEIKGRRIHLEVSRIQEKSKKERNRSPERDRGRGRDGRDGGRKNERFAHHQNRDDYRPSRNHSPRRNDYQRDDGYGRDRGHHDGGRGRGRSRSPGRYGRQDKNSYRRRSPSPYERSRHDREIGLPRRHGFNVPDVQILAQPDVDRGFVNWVETTFKSKGLKSEDMILGSRYSKDDVIRHQVAEGVHAVVDLDLRAQSLGKIPVTAFIRSTNDNEVQFNQYENLDPSTAADVIVGAKASSKASAQPAYGGGYPNSYGGQAQPAFAAPQYPQRPGINATDMVQLMGQLGQAGQGTMDPATLQALLASIQTSPFGAAQPGPSVAPPVQPVDVQALLSSLGNGGNGGNGGNRQPPLAPYGGGSYGAQGGASNATTDATVQNIMAQLARYRQ